MTPPPDPTVPYEAFTFTSQGTDCSAWHFRAVDDRFATEAGRPVVVLAHGFGGTKDSGLGSFASGFAEAGFDAVAFDYRNFGASGGEDRQKVSIAAQLDDYRAALAAAAARPGVDPHRVVLWGISLAGGHVLTVAAERPDLAAVVSVIPMVDGLAAGRLAFQHYKPTQVVRSSMVGFASRLGTLRGRPSRLIPQVNHPGELGCMTLDGAYEAVLRNAGPTWRNEVAAEVTLELGNRTPLKASGRITCPALVQIADFDRSAPPQSAALAAFRARAEVRHYPGDHFDFFPGDPFHEISIEHAVRFLVRHVGENASTSATESEKTRA